MFDPLHPGASAALQEAALRALCRSIPLFDLHTDNAEVLRERIFMALEGEAFALGLTCEPAMLRHMVEPIYFALIQRGDLARHQFETAQRTLWFEAFAAIAESERQGPGDEMRERLRHVLLKARAEGRLMLEPTLDAPLLDSLATAIQMAGERPGNRAQAPGDATDAANLEP